LAGCGTINERMAAGVSDAIPAWAGGLPADAPPRPGTAKYDEYMRERTKAIVACVGVRRTAAGGGKAGTSSGGKSLACIDQKFYRPNLDIGYLRNHCAHRR
jgi:hypothetical protein